MTLAVLRTDRVCVFSSDFQWLPSPKLVAFSGFSVALQVACCQNLTPATLRRRAFPTFFLPFPFASLSRIALLLHPALIFLGDQIDVLFDYFLFSLLFFSSPSHNSS